MTGPIQVVVVRWGRRYPARHVNGLLADAARLSSRPLRLVCITDDPEGLDPGIEVLPFPDWGDWFETLKKGCRLKLSIFWPGLLDPDLPTVFLDLDTAVVGDLARLAECLERTGGLYMMRGMVLPLWRMRGLLGALWPRRYYYGNSPVLAFWPRDWTGLTEAFREEFAYVRWRGVTRPWPEDRICKTDERFISWYARDVSRVFPKRLAVKFTTEYMTPWVDLSGLKGRLPWVRARRRSQVLVTFSGKALKPSEIARTEEKRPLRYRRYRATWIWPEFTAYWRRLGAAEVEATAAPERSPELASAAAATAGRPGSPR